MPADDAPATRGRADTPTGRFLGPHVVGQRVVVRRVVPGETGPSGGPAMTDLLGVCVAWPETGDGDLVLLLESGDRATVPLVDVVAGKPVPPRPTLHSRLDAATADLRAAPGWSPGVTEPLGTWLLRDGGGYTKRANSVLALGDPGMDPSAAVDQVGGWYAARGLVPRAHVLPDSPQDAAFRDAGWETIERTLLLLATPAAVRRGLRRGNAAGPGLEVAVEVSDRLEAAWLATDARAAEHLPASRAVLEAGPEEEHVWFCTVRHAGEVVARGRGALHGSWLGLASLWTRDDLRGRGLGRAVLAELLERGTEAGATTTYVQVVMDNEGARRLYGRLGWTEHHRYDYREAPV